MKKLIVAVAVICLFCSSAYAADYCDTKYLEIINKLKKTGSMPTEGLPGHETQPDKSTLTRYFGWCN